MIALKNGSRNGYPEDGFAFGWCPQAFISVGFT